MTSTENNLAGSMNTPYEGNPHMEKLFAEIIKSEDFKRATSSMIRVMFNQWAGESSAKKWIANPLEKGLKKVLIKPAEPSGAGAQGADGIGDLIGPLAGLIGEMMGRVSTFAKSIDELPPEEKEKLIEKLSGSFNTEQLGDMMGMVSRMIQTDERIGLAPLINTGAKKLLDVVTRFNENFSEESKENSESSSSSIEAIDGVTIGKLLNQFIKIIKKVQKRTEYMKDPDFLETENVWINKMEEIGSELDIGFLIQSRMNLEKHKESLKNWLLS